LAPGPVSHLYFYVIDHFSETLYSCVKTQEKLLNVKLQYYAFHLLLFPMRAPSTNVRHANCLCIQYSLITYGKKIVFKSIESRKLSSYTTSNFLVLTRSSKPRNRPSFRHILMHLEIVTNDWLKLSENEFYSLQVNSVMVCLQVRYIHFAFTVIV
jgi:hypothetical protein